MQGVISKGTISFPVDKRRLDRTGDEIYSIHTLVSVPKSAWGAWWALLSGLNMCSIITSAEIVAVGGILWRGIYCTCNENIWSIASWLGFIFSCEEYLLIHPLTFTVVKQNHHWCYGEVKLLDHAFLCKCSRLAIPQTPLRDWANLY